MLQQVKERSLLILQSTHLPAFSLALDIFAVIPWAASPVEVVYSSRSPSLWYVAVALSPDSPVTVPPSALEYHILCVWQTLVITGLGLCGMHVAFIIMIVSPNCLSWVLRRVGFTHMYFCLLPYPYRCHTNTMSYTIKALGLMRSKYKPIWHILLSLINF